MSRFPSPSSSPVRGTGEVKQLHGGFISLTIFHNITIKYYLALLLAAGLFGLAPAWAFTIVPAAAPDAKAFVPSQSYTLQDGSSAVVTRNPISFTSIKPGGTDDFLAQLKKEYPEARGWKFSAASQELKGSFRVSAYNVFFNGALGGGFSFDYLAQEDDPVTTADTQLHWIQRIVSNHKRGSAHGTPENRIAFQGQSKNSKQPETPFFDLVPAKTAAKSIPPHFQFDVGKVDPENEHQWYAEVYLASVNTKNPKTVTIYNGVRWGWENRMLPSAPAPAAH